MSIPLSTLSRTLFGMSLIGITLLACWPTDELEMGTGWDKTNHLLAFFVLFLLADYSWSGQGLLKFKVAGLLAYGLLLELLQGFVPNRELSLLDLMTNGLGMLLYWLLRQPMLVLRRYMQQLPFIAPESSISD